MVSPVELPYSPALQLLHTPAPATLYVPDGHTAADPLVDPATHAYPALHSPEHASDVSPGVAPYVPAGHCEHDPDPATANLPAAHTAAVAELDPATHAYPALHSPLHPGVVSPVVAPYVPAGHGAVHDALVSPELEPYSPAGQSVHTAEPPRLYFPAGQMAAVALVDPATHAYPALQFPEHAGVDKPAAAPNVPPGHKPEHTALDSPVLDPNVPTGHELHTLDPDKLYVPGPHTTAVPLDDPDAHAYPAVQLPLHDALGMPAVPPYKPAAQAVHTSVPPRLYVPGGHWVCVADVDPAGHA